MIVPLLRMATGCMAHADSAPVAVGEPWVVGGIEAGDVGAALSRAAGAYEPCVSAGPVTMRIVIDEFGRVEEANAIGPHARSAANCAVDATLPIQFVPPVGGTAVVTVEIRER